jgi:hypothetical protein
MRIILANCTTRYGNIPAFEVCPSAFWKISLLALSGTRPY